MAKSAAKATQVIYEKGKLYDLAIADLQADPDQPRKYFDEHPRESGGQAGAQSNKDTGSPHSRG